MRTGPRLRRDRGLEVEQHRLAVRVDSLAVLLHELEGVLLERLLVVLVAVLWVTGELRLTSAALGVGVLFLVELDVVDESLGPVGLVGTVLVLLQIVLPAVDLDRVSREALEELVTRRDLEGDPALDLVPADATHGRHLRLLSPSGFESGGVHVNHVGRGAHLVHVAVLGVHVCRPEHGTAKDLGRRCVGGQTGAVVALGKMVLLQAVRVLRHGTAKLRGESAEGTQLRGRAGVATVDGPDGAFEVITREQGAVGEDGVVIALDSAELGRLAGVDVDDMGTRKGGSQGKKGQLGPRGVHLG